MARLRKPIEPIEPAPEAPLVQWTRERAEHLAEQYRTRLAQEREFRELREAVDARVKSLRGDEGILQPHVAAGRRNQHELAVLAGAGDDNKAAEAVASADRLAKLEASLTAMASERGQLEGQRMRAAQLATMGRLGDAIAALQEGEING
jgi:small-conductance mechanosensitive channel